MKNIFLSPTDKPSRFSLNSIGKYHLTNQLHTNSRNFTNQYIYITSDEEIKDGYYSFYPPFGVGKNIFIGGELCFHIESKDGKGSFTQRTYQTLDKNKKIILTTDQDLIKDGVQGIDDEFLEWFVKNPTCEWVRIAERFINKDYDSAYVIIIPQEEPNKYTIT